MMMKMNEDSKMPREYEFSTLVSSNVSGVAKGTKSQVMFPESQNESEKINADATDSSGSIQINEYEHNSFPVSERRSINPMERKNKKKRMKVTIVDDKNSDQSIAILDSTTEGDNNSVPDRRSSLTSSVNSDKLSHISNKNQTSVSTPSHMERTIRSMGVWSRFMNDDNIWRHQEFMFDDEEDSWISKIREFCNELTLSLKSVFYTVMHHPSVLISSGIVFIIVLVAGLLAVQAQSTVYTNQLKDLAEDIAKDASSEFSKALDDAGRGPLFTMSQFIKNLDSFRRLSNEIGQLNGLTQNWAPLRTNSTTHRDLSNTSATDPDFIAQYNKIASGIKEDAGLDKILVNIQLAPMGVVSMLYPLINYEDFASPLYLNNTGAVGHDLIHDPNRVEQVRATLESEKPVVVGPLTLIQGDNPVVRECFIMRLAVNISGYIINIPENREQNLPAETFNSWGMAVVLINWANAKEKTGLYEKFKADRMEFILTSVNVNPDGTSKIKILANSSEWESLNQNNSVVINLDTFQGQWTMRVGYLHGFNPPWKVGMQTLVIVIALATGFLIMIILAIRKQYKDLLYNMMPPQIIKRLRNGETVVQKYDNATIFFSDVVEFTKLSGEMGPFEVMSMLNEIYTAFDALVRKHGVYKVETIGDAYFVIGGGPDRLTSVEGAKRVAMFALDAMEFVKSYRTEDGMQIFVRAGMASGPVVGGVVGITNPKFSLFGDTVNLASRMESSSKQMRIQCSILTYNLLREARGVKFDCKERHEDATDKGISLKGKGFQKTWWVNGVIETTD